MKITHEYCEIGTNRYQLEKFLPTSYRVRLIVDENITIMVGVLSKKKIDKSGRVRNAIGFTDEGHSHEYKWIGSNIATRVDTWADNFTIAQALAAVRQTWINETIEAYA